MWSYSKLYSSKKDSNAFKDQSKLLPLIDTSLAEGNNVTKVNCHLWDPWILHHPAHILSNAVDTKHLICYMFISVHCIHLWQIKMIHTHYESISMREGGILNFPLSCIDCNEHNQHKTKGVMQHACLESFSLQYCSVREWQKKMHSPWSLPLTKRINSKHSLNLNVVHNKYKSVKFGNIRITASNEMTDFFCCLWSPCPLHPMNILL